MRRRTDDRSPRVDAVDPVRLEQGSAADLVAGARLDGLLLADLDLAGRDLSGLVLDECRLEAVVLDDSRLDGWRAADSVLERVTGTSVRAPGSSLRDVRISGCRFGAAEWFEPAWDRVRVDGCRIDYLSLADGRLADVLLTGCTIGDLDLRGATLQRVAFRDCRVGGISVAGATARHLDLRGADLDRVDGVAGLRGAVVSEDQLQRLAPLLAAELGVEVEG